MSHQCKAVSVASGEELQSARSLTRQDGDRVVVSRVAERDAGTSLQLESFSLLLADIKCDGHGPHSAVCQAHVVQHGLVVSLVQEAFQRGEATVDDEFQIA